MQLLFNVYLTVLESIKFLLSSFTVIMVFITLITTFYHGIYLDYTSYGGVVDYVFDFG